MAALVLDKSSSRRIVEDNFAMTVTNNHIIMGVYSEFSLVESCVLITVHTRMTSYDDVYTSAKSLCGFSPRLFNIFIIQN